ncbi:hypothetical protein SKAU_G00387160 [Synaphobranchus kaupii]|uniref:Reverse transcriptase domain-containing protein n=1 Tax=Synaphobranchus kaupii TaxID=118154 RepID=A0A9Q1EAS0_SYNKA|nr:hypothetical protein SKAU_G00387160 [Synaphobranchus kaupii]
MSRGEFVKVVLLDLLKADPGGVFCLQKNGAVKAFDLSLGSSASFEAVMKLCKEKSDQEPLSSFEVTSLECRNYKIVTTHVYNPYVADEVIRVFLSRYGEVMPGTRLIRDGYGIWMAKRQYRMRLKDDPRGHDGLVHPPAYFSIGADRGYLFYSGQPSFCRQCQKFGHTAGNCAQGTCRNCGQQGHNAVACPKPKRCHGCGKEGHLFRECPETERSYADVAAGMRGPSDGKPAPKDVVPERGDMEAVKEGKALNATPVMATGEGEAPSAEAREGEEQGREEVSAAREERTQEGVESLKNTTNRRQRAKEGSESGDNSSEEGMSIATKVERRRRRKAPKKAGDSLEPPSEKRFFSGLPLSGRVAVEGVNQPVLQQWGDEEAGPSGGREFNIIEAFSVVQGRVLGVDCGQAFGRGFWKLNVSVLQDKAFVEGYEDAYGGWVALRPVFSSLREWWDWVKLNTKRYAIGYCKMKAQRERGEFFRMQREMEDLFVDGNLKRDRKWEGYAELQERLRRFFEGRARAFMFSSSRVFLEKDETYSSYFFNSVKEHRKRKVVRGLRAGDGNVKTGTGEMVEVATNFYKQFFGKRAVPEALREGLETDFCLEELREALRGLKANKAPGADGLPAEFYRAFWEMVGPDLLEVARKIFREGRLGDSMREGVITLLFKKGEQVDLRNWRPVTLLCVDYKIIAKVLTGRMKEALPHVIHEDQTCGVAGRQLHWSLGLVRDAISWARDRKLPLMLVGLDQEKAFDRVSHEFLWRVLVRVGFGPRFIRWVRILYTGVGSRVNMNGHLSALVLQEAGVRQGCPLSPLLYVLFLEPLAAVIRGEGDIKGLAVPGGGGREVKLAQYADDTTLILGNDRSLGKALEQIARFAQASGSKLNMQKSKVKFCGLWEGRRESMYGLACCEGSFRMLGVGMGGQRDAEENWLERIGKVRRKLGLWSTRRLSVTGKILVVKAEVLPALVFLAQVFPLPPRLKSTVQGWDNRYPKAEQLPPHYGQVVRWARRFTECRDKGLCLDHRALYAALIERLCVARVLGVSAETWQMALMKGLGNRQKDLNWLVVHGRLPVRERLFRHSITWKYCPRDSCMVAETVAHVFWGCPFAQAVWKEVGLFFPIMQGVSYEGITVGKDSKNRQGRKIFLWWLVVSLVKFGLWEARGLLVRHNAKRGVKRVVGKVRSELGRRVQWEVTSMGYHKAKERWKDLYG